MCIILVVLVVYFSMSLKTFLQQNETFSKRKDKESERIGTFRQGQLRCSQEHSQESSSASLVSSRRAVTPFVRIFVSVTMH